MIVRNVEAGWEVVYQSAHALLAGQIAAHLRKPQSIRYWTETLAAIIDHDELKASFGSNIYLTELGAPKDFTQFQFKARERYDDVQRRIDNGYRKHRWIGLLATRHAEELYGQVNVSKKLETLLGIERQKRASVLQELKTSEQALEIAYAIFQWCDRASLILCQKALPAMHRRLEVASLGDRKRYEIWENEEQAVSVDPWPFDSDKFEVHVEVRTIQQMTFTNDRELERCLKECEVEDRFWTIEKCE